MKPYAVSLTDIKCLYEALKQTHVLEPYEIHLHRCQLILPEAAQFIKDKNIDIVRHYDIPRKKVYLKQLEI